VRHSPSGARLKPLGAMLGTVARRRANSASLWAALRGASAPFQPHLAAQPQVCEHWRAPEQEPAAAAPAQQQAGQQRQRDRLQEEQSFLRRRGRPFVLAGTNVVLEDEQVVLEIAREVKRVCAALGLTAVFKCSWDKANRTRGDAYRGLGMERGLRVLERVKRETGLPVLTDVHETGHVAAVAAVADMLQVPSFLCRQTDLIAAAARTGLPLNLKRGQFASAQVMAEAVLKARAAGAQHVLVCERGVVQGPDALVFDPRQLLLLRRACGPGTPVVVDVTHCCQTPPSAALGRSGGSRDMLPLVARAAAAAGVDGVFLECHPDPDRAPVDSQVQLRLADLEPLLRDVLAIASIEPRLA
jgi:2-dehydro-3-deoxyphosphooctonate aldolase (KDO 8-P synthase)